MLLKGFKVAFKKVTSELHPDADFGVGCGTLQTGLVSGKSSEPTELK